MEILNFYNVKGGCGKSSLAFLTGKFLASQGYKTLLIDSDPQRSLTRALKDDSQGKSLFDFLLDACQIQDAITGQNGNNNLNENLFLIPSNLKILKIQNNIIQNQFEKAFQSLKGFDYIIFDNAPTFNNLIIAGIQASNQIIIPAQISLFDFQEVEFVINECRKIKDDLKISIVLNRVQNQEKFSKDEIEYLELFQAEFREYILKTSIPNSILVRRAIDRQEPLTGKSKAKTRFRLNYAQFMTELTGQSYQLELF